MTTYISKYLPYILAGLFAYLAPIKTDLIFVGALCMFDWLTGLLKGIKTHQFKSAVAIRKFWVSAGYLLGLLIGRSVEVYFNNTVPIVKPMVAIIALSEIQSLRENIQMLTGLDILKSITTLFKSNGTKNQNN